MQSSSLQFADAAKTLANATRAAGALPPTFRSPPRAADRDRTIRRRAMGSPVVSVRLGDRPFVAVTADMIEGVVAANDLRGVDADALRRRLWSAICGDLALGDDAGGEKVRSLERRDDRSPEATGESTTRAA